ncbi:MAG: Mur ligase family protein [Bacteroidota bacterium]|nr:Mur ligase family protein [Bacteroidota bacterium]
MHIHFIAIGGAAMHNLALALHSKGYHVTGSDDEIKEPSQSRLKAVGLLPEKEGWYPEKLMNRPDAVILGMHARADNPELLKAQELGLSIYSFPEYFYEQSKNKTRVVIGGSHGKTTITSMILHVLKALNKNFDYMVGSTVAGFDTMVRLSDDAPYIILEGDEYLSSPIDRRPKFHLYKAHIALLSGIAWDHINVFPTFENYVSQFQKFADELPEGGTLIYYRDDAELQKIATTLREEVNKISYGSPDYFIKDGISVVRCQGEEFPLQVFGLHNLSNLEGAREVCKLLGVADKEFYNAASSFTGAGRRMELVKKTADQVIFRDFAHSPSKLKATVAAAREQFPERKIIACMELHTFSSLSENFLEQYAGSMSSADHPVVYFNPQTIAHKKLAPISVEQVKNAFADEHLSVFNDPDALEAFIKANFTGKSVLLMMSSGTFDGISIENLLK